MRWMLFSAAIVFAFASWVLADEPGGNSTLVAGGLYPSPQIIKPGDVLYIEIGSVVPVAAYRTKARDLLRVRANGPVQPLDCPKYCEIQADGTIDLGSQYGSIRAAGMTTREIVTIIDERLRKWVAKPTVCVEVESVADSQPIAGQYSIGADGTINLLNYGVVRVAGETVAEAKAAIDTQLARYLDSPSVSLTDDGSVYYLHTLIDGPESVRKLPRTGNETVLDVLSQANVAWPLSDKKIRIVRLNEHRDVRILRVDWDPVRKAPTRATNYHLLPGDWVIVEAVGWSSRPGSWRTMGRSYIRTRNGL